MTTALARLTSGTRKAGIVITRGQSDGVEPEHDAGGWFYPVSSSPYRSDHEGIESSFESYVQQAYKANGIVFACMEARRRPFSEARFIFQDTSSGRPGKLFGSTSLALLETPWPNGTTGELLSRMIQDADIAGNFYATKVGGSTGIGTGPERIRRLRPDWVTILSGVKGDPEASAWELAADVLGYFYAPGGRKEKTVLLTPDRVAHWSPIPDPEAQWRGMSWLTPVLREVQADSYATRHKLRFFEKGATLSTVIKYDKEKSADELRRYKALFDEQYSGASNAYSALHIGGGADISVLGTNMQQIDFKAVQGAGETRIASASGVGAIIAMLSEGLAGSALNAGNYTAAKRHFADMTLRPNWRGAAAAVSKLVAPSETPARLWYDVRDVELLKEDRKDAAEIRQIESTTMTTLINGGFVSESVVAYMDTDDRDVLEHSGLTSVQLQRPPAGTEELTLTERVDALGSLVRAGFVPAAAATALGLPPIEHTGLVPITVTEPQGGP